MRHYWVYMLRCCDGKYYVGVTNDITYRIDQHQNGTNKKAFTHKRRPVTLVYSAQFRDINEAIAWEKQLKGWGRKKKEALMHQEQFNLEWYAKRSGVRRSADQMSC